MRAHRLTPQADRDFVEVLSYLVAGSPNAGHVFVEELFSALELLGIYPEMGPVAFDAFGSVGAVRMWSIHGFKRWRVFYAFTDSEIVVLRILHVSRGIESLFDE